MVNSDYRTTAREMLERYARNRIQLPVGDRTREMLEVGAQLEAHGWRLLNNDPDDGAGFTQPLVLGRRRLRWLGRRRTVVVGLSSPQLGLRSSDRDVVVAGNGWTIRSDEDLYG